MKVKFEDPGRNDCLAITAEDSAEAEKLQRWNSCIVSSEFDYNYNGKPSHPTLILIKEI